MEKIAKDNKEREAVLEYLKWLGRDDDFMAVIDREEYNRIQMQTTIDYEKDLANKEGIKEGMKQKTKESAINFYKNSVSKEIICDSLNITIDKLEEILKEVD